MTYIDLKTRADLVTLYSEKHRHYHNIDHIYDCLAKLEEYSSAVKLSEQTYDMIQLALWFHDVIYIPRSKKNEENSAILFLNTFSSKPGMTTATIDLIVSSILCTKTHYAVNDIDKVVCDIDLSILGAERKYYAQYQYDIWQEYKFVPHDKFKIGRRAFLNGMLQKHEIFSLEYFKNLYEKQARENMKWELTILK